MGRYCSFTCYCCLIAVCLSVQHAAGLQKDPDQRFPDSSAYRTTDLQENLTQPVLVRDHVERRVEVVQFRGDDQKKGSLSEHGLKKNRSPVTTIAYTEKKRLKERALSLFKGLYFASIGGASAWMLLKIAEKALYDDLFSLHTAATKWFIQSCSERLKQRPLYQKILASKVYPDIVEKLLKISVQVGFCAIIVYAHKEMDIFDTAYGCMKEAFS